MTRNRKTPAQWVRAAERAIVDLLEHEHACVWDEIEAKLSEQPWQGHPTIDPHHLSTAQRNLIKANVIHKTAKATRGGRQITTLSLTDTLLTTTATEKAAARKRVLNTRYRSWATGNGKHPERVGRAGEDAGHASLLKASTINPSIQPLNIKSTTTTFRYLLGHDLQKLGPLDNAAYFSAFDSQYRPLPPIFLPIEIKNRRDWVYPASSQLHQVLHKAAWLADNEPDQPIIPVLICRRAQYTTFTMAKELGFFVIDAESQPIISRAEDNLQHYEEVKAELGFSDLTTDIGPNDRVVNRLAASLPKIAQDLAPKWRHFGPPLMEYFELLRKDDLGGSRNMISDGLRHAALELGAEPGKNRPTPW